LLNHELKLKNNALKNVYFFSLVRDLKFFILDFILDFNNWQEVGKRSRVMAKFKSVSRVIQLDHFFK